MKDGAQKNILFLAMAGIVFVVLNVAILMATKNGSLAPIENLTLWGAFVVLNVSSLLWAVSLLGLQPLVIAFSYLAGGFVAFMGVRLLPEANVAEVTTAGATYGAFGAVAIGNVTTKVRLAFFDKKQVPFIFVIAALLLMDGFLNSRVSSAGWGVIINALVLPFVIAGVAVGLLWTLLARIGIGNGLVPYAVESAADLSQEEYAAVEAEQIMFKIPEGSEEPAVAMEVAEPVIEQPEPVALKIVEEPAVQESVTLEIVEEPAVLESQEEAPVDAGNFFPLEIDKGDEIIPLQEDPQPIASVVQIVESAPELVEEPVSVQEANPEIIAEESLVLDTEPASELEEKKDSSMDWLSGHMDLLNNIKKAS